MWSYRHQREGLFGLRWGLPIVIFSVLFVIGCARQVPSPEVIRDYQVYREVLENATTLREPQRELLKPEPEPLFKDLSPLSRRVTVAFFQEHYETILFFLSYEGGLSLVIDPAVRALIPPDRERITLQMKHQPLEEILKKVCEILDIHYKLERGILRILPYEERLFHLGFMPVVKVGRSSMGGNVLGGGAGYNATTTSSFRGEFLVEASLDAQSQDVYRAFGDSLESLMRGSSGVYTFNRLTGVLYVKDRPSRVKAVAHLVEEFKKRYEKQIILDVQIIEVALNKGHQLGIDWANVAGYPLGQNYVSLNQLNLDVGLGRPLTLSLLGDRTRINLILNFLKEFGELKVISNPKIRALHSQPAIISVGTSRGYIRQIRRTTEFRGNGTDTYFEPIPDTIFDGVILGIIPYISEGEDIFLHIVPIKSDLISLEEKIYGTQNERIMLPTVALREMSSIIKARNNDLIVIGGLIFDKVESKDTKWLNLPIISEIFRSQKGTSEKREMVLLIRVLVN